MEESIRREIMSIHSTVDVQTYTTECHLHLNFYMEGSQDYTLQY